jgi:3-methyladenine DNA glycosylase Tag
LGRESAIVKTTAWAYSAQPFVNGIQECRSHAQLTNQEHYSLQHTYPKILLTKDPTAYPGTYKWNCVSSTVNSFTVAEKVSHQTQNGISTAPESIGQSKDLKKKRWEFRGPTKMHSFIQAMVWSMTPSMSAMRE